MYRLTFIQYMKQISSSSCEQLLTFAPATDLEDGDFGSVGTDGKPDGTLMLDSGTVVGLTSLSFRSSGSFFVAARFLGFTGNLSLGGGLLAVRGLAISTVG